MNSELRITGVPPLLRNQRMKELGTTRAKDIRQRSFDYTLRAVKLYQHLQKQRVGWILGKQFLRAASSIGANIEEAQAGESRSDFIHKLGIARTEARESLYWLRVMAQSNIVPQRRIQPLMQETNELFDCDHVNHLKNEAQLGGLSELQFVILNS